MDDDNRIDRDLWFYMGSLAWALLAIWRHVSG